MQCFVLQAKPRPGEAGVRITQVPAAHPQESLAIRFFDGGLALRGQYMFDLFDLRSKTALNMPDGFVFYPHFRPGQVPFLGHVMSWEEAGRMAKSDIPAGEERFSLPEGVVVELRRPGMPPFYFEVPVREVVSSVKPATSIPFSM